MALADFFRARRSASRPALAAFLHAQAAFVASKTVEDYCRVKAGLRAPMILADPDFAAALLHCRWQVFFAAVSDLAAVVEADLRPLAGPRAAALAHGLAEPHARAMLAAPPPHDELAAGEARVEAFGRHLLALQAGAPKPPDRMPLLAEPVLFATLPIHPAQRRGEEPSIRGALRFHVVSAHQEYERRFDRPALAVALVGA